MAGYYDYDGNPISHLVWSELFEARRREARAVGPRWRVGHDEIGDYTISTVWDELDHRFGAGPPSIFETLVQGPDGFEEVARCPTAEEAAAGHHEWIAVCSDLVAMALVSPEDLSRDSRG